MVGPPTSPKPINRASSAPNAGGGKRASINIRSTPSPTRKRATTRSQQGSASVSDSTLSSGAVERKIKQLHASPSRKPKPKIVPDFASSDEGNDFNNVEAPKSPAKRKTKVSIPGPPPTLTPKGPKKISKRSESAPAGSFFDMSDDDSFDEEDPPPVFKRQPKGATPNTATSKRTSKSPPTPTRKTKPKPARRGESMPELPNWHGSNNSVTRSLSPTTTKSKSTVVSNSLTSPSGGKKPKAKVPTGGRGVDSSMGSSNHRSPASSTTRKSMPAMSSPSPGKKKKQKVGAESSLSGSSKNSRSPGAPTMRKTAAVPTIPDLISSPSAKAKPKVVMSNPSPGKKKKSKVGQNTTLVGNMPDFLSSPSTKSKSNILSPRPEMSPSPSVKRKPQLDDQEAWNQSSRSQQSSRSTVVGGLAPIPDLSPNPRRKPGVQEQSLDYMGSSHRSPSRKSRPLSGGSSHSVQSTGSSRRAQISIPDLDQLPSSKRHASDAERSLDYMGSSHRSPGPTRKPKLGDQDLNYSAHSLQSIPPSSRRLNKVSIPESSKVDDKDWGHNSLGSHKHSTRKSSQGGSRSLSPTPRSSQRKSKLNDDEELRHSLHSTGPSSRTNTRLASAPEMSPWKESKRQLRGAEQNLDYLGSSHRSPSRPSNRKSDLPPTPESPSSRKNSMKNTKSASNDGNSSTEPVVAKQAVKPTGSKKGGADSVADDRYMQAMKYFGTESERGKDVVVMINGKIVPNPSERSEGGTLLASRTLVLVWSLVSAELLLDLITTIISFIALVRETECCDEPVDMGRLPLIVTIPFLFLILLELGLLIYCIRLTLSGKKPAEESVRRNNENNNNNGRSIWRLMVPSGTSNAQDGSFTFRVINVLVLLNPFFGCFVAWMLLYQTSKAESFSVLGIEGMSIILHWFSVYLEGYQQTKWSIALHLSPLIPFLVTVVVILVYLQLGGVCYLVEDSVFWYDGCQVCDDGSIPQSTNDPNVPDVFSWSFTCPDGGKPQQDDYCGEDNDTKFCFFKY